MFFCVFFFQAEDGIRDLVRSRGLGDVYKRQPIHVPQGGYQGTQAGEESHTLTNGEMPQHTHVVSVDQREATSATPDTSSYLAKTSAGTSAYASTATNSMAGAAVASQGGSCLLYTSDAADERSSVDLGGRRIIKKKTRAVGLRRRGLMDRQ